MKSLREYIAEYAAQKKAIGHFNFSNLEGFWAIVRAAKEAGEAVILGTSEKEREAVGLSQAAALVASVRAEGQPVFLNADHFYSPEVVKEAIDAGYDMVIFDGAKLPLDENIEKSTLCVSYARASGRDVLVEVELGYIGTGSTVRDAIPEGVSLENLTAPEDAARLIRESGADLLAPAVGNIHGMLRGGVDPRLNIERIQEIRNAAGVPLVLHGGSGNEADFKEAIAGGMAVVHINTELRVAYTSALKEFLVQHPEEYAPYAYGTAAGRAMEELVLKHVREFGGKPHGA